MKFELALLFVTAFSETAPISGGTIIDGVVTFTGIIDIKINTVPSLDQTADITEASANDKTIADMEKRTLEAVQAFVIDSQVVRI